MCSAPAEDELALLRERTAVVGRTASTHRDVTLAVLEGLATLHFDRVGGLVGEAPVDVTGWPTLERAVSERLVPWPGEAP